MKAERWLPIPGYEGYDVSDQGRVRSWRPYRGDTGPRFVQPTIDKRGGYLRVSLHVDGKPKVRRIHVLVTRAFRGTRPAGLETRHLDGDRNNNCLSNLAYGTHLQNMRDKARHGTDRNANKTHCIQGHPFDDVNTYARPRGGRGCRTCDRNAGAAYRSRLRNRMRSEVAA